MEQLSLPCVATEVAPTPATATIKSGRRKGVQCKQAKRSAKSGSQPCRRCGFVACACIEELRPGGGLALVEELARSELAADGGDFSVMSGSELDEIALELERAELLRVLRILPRDLLEVLRARAHALAGSRSSRLNKTEVPSGLAE